MKGFGLFRFLRDERGAVSIMALTWLPLTLMVGGLALDTANAMRVRTQLQTVADAAAHAALFTRETQSVTTAKAAARDVIATALPSSVHGEVIRDDDIVFGRWDPDAQTFTADATSRDGVRIDLARVSARSNRVGTWLLQMAGFTHWDIQRIAVFETWQPSCLRQGYTAEGIVNIQSNNSFINGFCIHSNTRVEANSNNFFEEGTTVSMPDINDMTVPASGWSSNVGLAEALRNDVVDIRILSRLPQVISAVGTHGSYLMPSYITSSTVVTLPSKSVGLANLMPGRIHRYTCVNNEKMHIGNGTVLTNMVLSTNCAIIVGNGVRLENAIIATTSTGADSIDAANGLQIGKNDNCAPGGGAQILTLGSVKIPSGLALYGGQVIAANDITFAANANGVAGASMIAGGKIDGTSNSTMGFCDGGMGGNIEAKYFRLAY